MLSAVRLPVLPVVHRPRTPRMKARLIGKRIEPAPFLGASELAILDPAHHPVELQVWLFI